MVPTPNVMEATVGESQDELEAVRHELADLNAAIESGDGDAGMLARVEELERLIAERQNPVGPAVDGEVVDVSPEEAEAFKPAAGELVVRDVGDEHSVFVVFDRHDEQQIIEEFQRRALKVMLYDFSQGGSRLVDLSYQGVNEAVRLMNQTGKCKIAIDRDAFGGRGFDEQVVTEDAGNGPEQFYVITVYAADAVTGYGQLGTSSEPKLMRLRDGSTKWDIFARTKALNKAQRNALKVMIPEALRQTLIATYRGDDVALRQIQAGAGAALIAELPPPLTDERAQALKTRARKLYEEIREHAPGGIKVNLLSAQFHAYLTRAEHDHERLEEFIGYLEQRLAEAKGGAS
jgi:hypothetical protein